MDKIDLNDFVLVKLTSAGISILSSKYDLFMSNYANQTLFDDFAEYLNLDSNGCKMMTLSQLIDTFGDYCSVGDDKPFEYIMKKG